MMFVSLGFSKARQVEVLRMAQRAWPSRSVTALVQYRLGQWLIVLGRHLQAQASPPVVLEPQSQFVGR